MKAFLATALLASVSSAADVNAADKYTFDFYVDGAYPGLHEGQNIRGIRVEGYFDLLCSNCSAFHPILTEFLDTVYYDSVHGPIQYRQAIEVVYNFMPLTFHYMTWNVHMVVPYLLQRCRAGYICRFHDYIEWCAENYAMILGMKDKSQTQVIAWLQNELLTMWPELNQSELEGLWGDKDPYNAFDYMVRQKGLATHKQVSDTPSLFVNGVKLNPVPLTVADMETLFNQLFDNQDARAKGIMTKPTDEVTE